MHARIACTYLELLSGLKAKGLGLGLGVQGCLPVTILLHAAAALCSSEGYGLLSARSHALIFFSQVLAQSPAILKAAEQEASIQAQLSHPALLPLLGGCWGLPRIPAAATAAAAAGKGCLVSVPALTGQGEETLALRSVGLMGLAHAKGECPPNA